MYGQCHHRLTKSAPSCISTDAEGCLFHCYVIEKATFISHKTIFFTTSCFFFGQVFLYDKVIDNEVLPLHCVLTHVIF